MYLLDTTALIDLIERLPRVLARFGQSLPGTVFASVISQGEVMIGLRLAHRLRPDGLTSEVERAADLLDSLIILPVTSTIASAYATIQADLMSRDWRE
jgi:predicted nucleic acid-binding protein